ncbi:translation initiation factor IF-2-like [Cricetulus griseus]|uniref:Translation initiation factor IF-2-like n=1 Tax=Cricetulus griseus TaxID=10029 RepID=A0A9J7H3W9_CRIGR|nr:translation initiation factor IF-2-like [Cricetulus griseus]
MPSEPPPETSRARVQRPGLTHTPRAHTPTVARAGTTPPPPPRRPKKLSKLSARSNPRPQPSGRPALTFPGGFPAHAASIPSPPIAPAAPSPTAPRQKQTLRRAWPATPTPRGRARGAGGLRPAHAPEGAGPRPLLSAPTHLRNATWPGPGAERWDRDSRSQLGGRKWPSPPFEERFRSAYCVRLAGGWALPGHQACQSQDLRWPQTPKLNDILLQTHKQHCVHELPCLMVLSDRSADPDRWGPELGT